MAMDARKAEEIGMLLIGWEMGILERL